MNLTASASRTGSSSTCVQPPFSPRSHDDISDLLVAGRPGDQLVELASRHLKLHSQHRRRGRRRRRIPSSTLARAVKLQRVDHGAPAHAASHRDLFRSGRDISRINPSAPAPTSSSWWRWIRRKELGIRHI